MAAHSGHQMGTLGGVVDGLPQNGGGKPALNGDPSGINPFGTVKRRTVGDTFTPASDSVTVGGNQQDAAIVDPAKASLEKIHERHFDFAQGESFDFHRNRLA